MKSLVHSLLAAIALASPLLAHAASDPFLVAGERLHTAILENDLFRVKVLLKDTYADPNGYNTQNGIRIRFLDQATIMEMPSPEVFGLLVAAGAKEFSFASCSDLSPSYLHQTATALYRGYRFNRPDQIEAAKSVIAIIVKAGMHKVVAPTCTNRPPISFYPIRIGGQTGVLGCGDIYQEFSIFLKEQGFEVNQVDVTGTTIGHEFALTADSTGQCINPEGATTLIALGVDLNKKSNAGLTITDYTQLRGVAGQNCLLKPVPGGEEFVKRLVDAGALPPRQFDQCVGYCIPC
jgi:hypothetical protein